MSKVSYSRWSGTCHVVKMSLDILLSQGSNLQKDAPTEALQEDGINSSSPWLVLEKRVQYLGAPRRSRRMSTLSQDIEDGPKPRTK